MPTPPVTSWTADDLAALTLAIKSGTKRVRFQDREQEFHSLEELLTLRDSMIAALTPSSNLTRQIRMRTETGL